MQLKTAVVLSVFLFLLLSPCRGFGGAKEDQAAKLLSEAVERQAKLWTHGPLRLTATLHAPKGKHGDLELQYEMYWAAPDKWRTEWSGSGFVEQSVLNGGKLYRYRNSAAPPLQAVAFEQALWFALGNSVVAPLFVPSVPHEAKIEIDHKKIGGVAAECLHNSAIGLTCIDPASGHFLTHGSNDIIAEYDRYAAAAGGSFPRAMRIRTSAGQLLAEVEMSLTTADPMPDSLFSPPTNADISEFAGCSDLQNNLTPPKVKSKGHVDYPSLALQGHAQGDVWVYAAVGSDGLVKQAKAIGTTSQVLYSAAADGIQHWQYSPYMRCGKPAPFNTLITVHFSMQ